MPIRKSTSRTTKGYNSTDFVAAELAYSTAPTYEDFVKAGTVGSVGIFKLAGEDELKATIATAALVGGDKFFIAQVLENVGTNAPGAQHVRKSPTFKFGDIVSGKVAAFKSPVAQETFVGFDGTKGELESSTGLISRYDDFELAILDTTEANLAFPTWNYGYEAKSSDTISDVAFGIVNKINNPLDLVNKEIRSIVGGEVVQGGGTATAIGGGETLSVENGSNLVTASGTSNGLAAGDLVEIDGALYQVESAAGADIVLTGNYAGATATGLAADVITAPTSFGIKVFSLEETVHFRVAVKGELADNVISYVTPFEQGSGAREEIARMEYEASIFDGVTTVNAQFRERYGVLSTFGKGTLAYDIVKLSYKKYFNSKAIPNSEDNHVGYVDIAAPITTGAPTANGYVDATDSPIAEIKTVLGL